MSKPLALLKTSFILRLKKSQTKKTPNLPMKSVKLKFKILKKSNPNKAPGITGLTSAFYKCFWPKIKELVTQAINNVLTNSKKTSS